MFNNLRDNIRGALSVKETASEDDEMNSYMDETVLVVYFGGNEQEMKESINLGESSEIFTNHTHRDFLKTIKKALINGGVDVVRLKELLDKDRVFDRKQFDEPSSFVREPPYNDLYKEYLDFKTEFYSSIIPVVFDLLENYGYTRYELER